MMKSVIAGFMLLTGVGMGAALYTLSKLFALDPRERYNVLRFKEDRLTIGYGLFAPTYKLNDIAEVRFSKSPARGRITLGGYTGYLQVVKTNGHWCRRISFDGSVYYKHTVWITNEHIIDLSTEILINELRQHAIWCVKEYRARRE